MTRAPALQRAAAIPAPALAVTPARSHLLQRKCACGGTPGLTGECEECSRKRLVQTKLAVSQPGDEFEQEADRVADAVVSGRSVTTKARTGSPAVQRQEAPEKPREQPTQFPAQEAPKSGQEKEDDDRKKLGRGGLKVAGELGKYLLDQFSSSAEGQHLLAALEHDWKSVIKFFEDFADTIGGKIALGAAGGAAMAGAFAGAQSARETSGDPDISPSTGGPVPRTPKDENLFGLELNWDFVTPPSGMTLKTPWLDSPKIPLGPKPPTATPALPPPPVLFKSVPKVPRICTPVDPQGDEGEADARSAFIFSWLQRNRALAEKRQQEIIEKSQLHAPPRFAPSVVKPMFKAKAGTEAFYNSQAIEAGLRSPGQPLDPDTRELMESRFGHDFSQVRVHSNGESAESAGAVNALAFTVGTDLFFAGGQYAPDTLPGQRLLAHELAHVVQQSESKERQSLGGRKTHAKDEGSSFFERAPQAATPLTLQDDTVPRPIKRILGSPGEPLGIGGVRIHRDTAAAESAQSLRARAYTYGQDIVFNRGEFDPSSPSGRTLLDHELAHTARQDSPSRYRLAFQKQTGAPQKFFQEVEDAVINLQGRVGAVAELRYLRDLLALSEAVEAQKQPEVKQLTPKVVSSSPTSAVPVARSEEFVNELITRTLLMGLDAEAGSLRTFFRALAAVPSRRHPTDTKFGPDKNLWQKLITVTVDQAKFGNAAEAASSIDSLLNTFRIIREEAGHLEFNEVLKERKLNYSAGVTYNSDTLDSYFSTLIGALRDLVVPILHGVARMMEAAIADLEADKGTDSLRAAKTVIDSKILPAFKLKIGDQNLLDLTVEATRSTFGSAKGSHLDYFDKSKAAEKRSVTIDYFDKNQTAGFSEKSNPVGYIIIERKRQVAFLEQFYVNANRAAMGSSPLKLESVDDWRSFLHEKVLELQKAGKPNDEVLRTIIKFLSGYLEAFTTSTPFNIEDVIKQDSENYNKRRLPRAITGQLIEDCGVYALRTVYMLSLVKSDLKLRVRFVYLPVHVGLIITGDSLPTLIAHNNKLYTMDAADMAKERKDWTAKDPTKPATDDQFIGEVAGAYFTSGVDVPFRLEEAPAISKNDPKEKEKLQKYYEGTLKKNVLADAPKAGITQFHLEYLRLNDESKKMHNKVVVPTWNHTARAVWQKHQDKLFAELTMAREGKPNKYAAESKAYLTDLDEAFKPVVATASAAEKSRQDVSTTLGAHPELTGPTATRGYGSRISFRFPWEFQLEDHKKEVANLANLKDLTKPAAITPPFAAPGGLLQPIY